jgi:hypothetical protein
MAPRFLENLFAPDLYGIAKLITSQSFDQIENMKMRRQLETWHRRRKTWHSVKYMSRNLIKYEQTPKVILKHQSNQGVRSDNEEQNKIIILTIAHFRLPSYMPPKFLLLARRDHKTNLVQYKHIAFNNKGTACTGTNFRIRVCKYRTASWKSIRIRKDLRPWKSIEYLCGSSRP